jgi:cytochrome c-type biogenesis protein CcsB
MNPLWVIPAIICYLAASAGYFLERTGAGPRWAPWATRWLIAGVALQALLLIAGGWRAGNIPVTDFAQSVGFLAWLTAVAGLILIWRWRMTVIGAFVAPLVVIGCGIAAIPGPHRLAMPASLRSAWLPVHVTLALTGCALFVLAASVSLVYLICERRLKAKRPLGAADELVPSLEKLDRINYRLLIWGFVMLSLAILTGALWADATWGHFWTWEPQESWSLVIWLMYAGLLESRLTAGWQGRRIAALTIVVFTVLLGSFVGVSLVAPGKHGGNFG